MIKVTKYLVLNKFKYVLPFLMLIFFTQQAPAQSKKPGTWRIDQTAAVTDSITITGIFKTKGIAGWRKVPENVYISITSNGKFVARDLQTHTEGEFTIQANLKDIEGTTITITLTAQDYSTIEIRDIPPKNTYLEVYTEKTAFRVNGK